MEKVYWTTKAGQKIDIDQMEKSHLINVLKMIVRKKNRFVGNMSFKTNGDMSNEFNNTDYNEDSIYMGYKFYDDRFDFDLSANVLGVQFFNIVYGTSEA